MLRMTWGVFFADQEEIVDPPFPLAYLFQTGFREGRNRDGARIREGGFI